MTPSPDDARPDGPGPRARAVLRACLVVGVALRLLLFAVNPPTNAFDDHFRPITLYLETGEVPDRDACWECYHPPAFYVSSAWVVQGATALGATPPVAQKIAHALPCLYGILTLLVLRALLLRLRLPDFATCTAFAVACFLPRHVYMSAIHSNDTIAYLGVTTSAWLAVRALDAGCRVRDLAWLAAVLAVTVLTKYTSMVVLPMAAASFGVAWWWRVGAPRARLVTGLALACVPALVVLALFAAPNVRDHGKAFPSNLELFHQDYLDSGRGRRDLDFLGFAPWRAIATPVLAPENRDSVWTVLWARAWFDMEPRFLPYTDPATPEWWEAYRTWLGGAEGDPWPGTAALTPWTRGIGGTLVALGLVPTALMLVGLFRCLVGRWCPLRPADALEAARLAMMPVLTAGVMAGITLTAWKFPYTFALKTVYILNGLPAFIALTALGADFLRRVGFARRALVAATVALCVASTAHVLHVVVAMLDA